MRDTKTNISRESDPSSFFEIHGVLLIFLSADDTQFCSLPSKVEILGVCVWDNHRRRSTLLAIVWTQEEVKEVHPPVATLCQNEVWHHHHHHWHHHHHHHHHEDHHNFSQMDRERVKCWSDEIQITSRVLTNIQSVTVHNCYNNCTDKK